LISYLPEEAEDALETKKLVEANGRNCFLYPVDNSSKESCRAVADEALKTLGRVNILVNNQAYQMVRAKLDDLAE
jgi:NAD(P)-dependent dehydrogenase (short-subunit alcohol dehydrogenase family)